MCSYIRVRNGHKSLHFLKLDFAAPSKAVFFSFILSKSFLFLLFLHLDPCFVRLGLILLQSLQVKTLQSVFRYPRSVEHMFEVICCQIGSVTMLFTYMINSCVVLSFMLTLRVSVTYWKYFPTFTKVVIRACFYILCFFF